VTQKKYMIILLKHFKQAPEKYTFEILYIFSFYKISGVLGILYFFIITIINF